MIDVAKLMSDGCRLDAKVGIGASRSLLAETSKRLSLQGCRIKLSRYSSAKDMIADLRSGRLDAAVRGTLGSAESMQCLRLEFRLERVMRTAVMESGQGKCFLLTPVGIDEGLSVDARLELVERSIAYFSRTHWSPSIGVLSKGRLEDVGRGEEIRRSIEEGTLLVKKLVDKGYTAEHDEILIENALKNNDLIVAPDGVTGNLIFRSVHFVGGGKAYGAPVVNLDRVFVDTSRAKVDFSEAVLLAAGLAGKPAKKQSRA